MIIITGASKGVGNFLYNKYKNEKIPVIGFYNSTSNKEILANGDFIKIDITEYDEINKWVSESESFLSDITLINCAGINYNSYGHKADILKWKKVIEVNLIGTFNVIQNLLPKMREQKFGRIINFSSVVAELPSPGISAYAASKSALIGLTKSLGVENANLNITINNLNLGYSELGMINEVPENYLNAIIERIPNGKLCSPDDIYQTIEYIRKTGYLNGTGINLNGCLI
jgi:NAD(P)-dependent dehydrogenase (short-subunit alcohol dehydrogenase family)